MTRNAGDTVSNCHQNAGDTITNNITEILGAAGDTFGDTIGDTVGDTIGGATNTTNNSSTTVNNGSSTDGSGGAVAWRGCDRRLQRGVCGRAMRSAGWARRTCRGLAPAVCGSCKHPQRYKKKFVDTCWYVARRVPKTCEAIQGRPNSADRRRKMQRASHA